MAALLLPQEPYCSDRLQSTTLRQSLWWPVSTSSPQSIRKIMTRLILSAAPVPFCLLAMAILLLTWTLLIQSLIMYHQPWSISLSQIWAASHPPTYIGYFRNCIIGSTITWTFHRHRLLKTVHHPRGLQKKFMKSLFWLIVLFSFKIVLGQFFLFARIHDSDYGFDRLIPTSMMLQE